MSIHTIYLAIRAIPKTVRFNFHYFSFRKALHFPVVVSHRVILKQLKGSVVLENEEKYAKGRIRIGFHENTAYDQKHNYAVWNNKGTIFFEGSAHIGNGTVIVCDGELRFGDEVAISGNSVVRCYKSITIGQGSLISDRCLLQDGDNHHIIHNGIMQAAERSISIGNHVWLATGCTVLKGVNIPNNVVIGNGTLVTKSLVDSDCIYVGSPIRKIKDGITWG